MNATMFFQFMDKDHYIDDGLVYADGKAIGLLAPSTLFGFDKTNGHDICGRKGIVNLAKMDKTSFWAALIESDSIIFGTDDVLSQCREILKQPLYSRTVSYLSTISTDCENLVSRFSSIRSSRILVLGCGGIGSLAAINLAGAGVGFITLIDHDIVEMSNLNRQFFWTQNDVGKIKAEVLQKTIKERFPDVRVAIQTKKLLPEDAALIDGHYDAIVITADEPLGIGREIAMKCRAFVAYAAYFQGFLGFIARKNDLPSFPGTDSIKWTRNPYFIGPSFGPGNTELAGAISSACIHYLSEGNMSQKVDFSAIWNSDRIGVTSLKSQHLWI
jgi:hypothetical protein